MNEGIRPGKGMTPLWIPWRPDIANSYLCRYLHALILGILFLTLVLLITPDSFI